MGNIYYEQKKYPQAVKQYRMALDQVPNTHKDMRYKPVLYLHTGLLMRELLFSLVYKQGQSLLLWYRRILTSQALGFLKFLII